MANSAHVELPIGVRTAQETLALKSGVVAHICRTSVRRDDGSSRQVTLLLDMQGLVIPSQADLEGLRAVSPSPAILAGMQTNHGGKVGAITLSEFEASSEDIAFAAAVCAASWGWDDSDQIRVAVNNRTWDVSPSFRDGMWTAAIV